jgi:hypothetical protein
VTFSDPKVAEVVNKNFVPAWFNRSPGFCNSDFTTEKSIFENSAEAFLTKNICTFVLAPDGRVFHYVAGYVSPELFQRFLEDALALRRAGFDGKMKPRPGGLDVMKRLHADLGARFQGETTAIAELPVFAERHYRGTRHAHTEQCRRVVQEASRYLARVHKHWSQVAAMPALDEVRFKYFYGNAFTEEGKGASGIASDPAVLVLI